MPGSAPDDEEERLSENIDNLLLFYFSAGFKSDERICLVDLVIKKDNLFR